MKIRNSGKLNLNLPKGVSILTDPLTASVNTNVEASVAMLDFAYRPLVIGPLHAALGLGLGVGHGSAFMDGSVGSTFLGTSMGSGKASAIFGALQGFAGIDIALGKRVVLSLMPRLVWIDGHPLGKDQRYLDWLVTSNFGLIF